MYRDDLGNVLVPEAGPVNVRVSTDDQNEQRQMRAIREKYDEDQEDNQIDLPC